MDKFQNKYRIPSARLQTWDYGWNAAYFITICTANREHYFGEIVDRHLVATAIGKIVETEWLKTPGLRPDMNLELGEFVVMPNHFHAILVIGKNKYNQNDRGKIGDQHDDYHTVDQRDCCDTVDQRDCRDAMHRVSTSSSSPQSSLSTPPPSIATNDLPHKNQFGPQRKNLASIMRGFKSSVTKNAHAINPAFGWQERFHDHIIRDDDECQRIAHYIANNPSNWENDKFYKEDGYNG